MQHCAALRLRGCFLLFWMTFFISPNIRHPLWAKTVSFFPPGFKSKLKVIFFPPLIFFNLFPHLHCHSRITPVADTHRLSSDLHSWAWSRAPRRQSRWSTSRRRRWPCWWLGEESGSPLACRETQKEENAVTFPGKKATKKCQTRRASIQQKAEERAALLAATRKVRKLRRQKKKWDKIQHKKSAIIEETM